MSDANNPGEVPATGLKDYSLTAKPEQQGYDLDTMSQDDLLSLRALVDSKLKNINIKDIDLPKELMIQYARAKKLQDDTLNGNDAPANQKAQVTNTCANLLAAITKTQLDVYNSQRAKEMEQILIKVLKTLPQEQQDAFFEEFDKTIREHDTP